jgi:hypothetical protein
VHRVVCLCDYLEHLLLSSMTPSFVVLIRNSPFMTGEPCCVCCHQVVMLSSQHHNTTYYYLLVAIFQTMVLPVRGGTGLCRANHELNEASSRDADEFEFRMIFCDVCCLYTLFQYLLARGSIWLPAYHNSQKN